MGHVTLHHRRRLRSRSRLLCGTTRPTSIPRATGRTLNLLKLISPAAWFADCADYVLLDTEEGCEELRLDLIDVLEAGRDRNCWPSPRWVCIRDAFLNNGMTVNHLRKPK